MNIIRFHFKSFDYKLIDQSILEIIKIIKTTGSIFKGPILLPTKRERLTILISPNIDKDARDQYEILTHCRIIDIINPKIITIDALLNFNISAGINITISLR